MNINTVKPADSSVRPEDSPIFTTRKNWPESQAGLANRMAAFGPRKCFRYRNTGTICDSPVAATVDVPTANKNRNGKQEIYKRRGNIHRRQEIKTYIGNRSIDSSLELFQKEMDVIDRHIDRLKSLRDNIITRRETISQARGLPLGTITLKEMPSRPCHRIMQSCETDDTSSMTRCSSFIRTESTASGKAPICRSATAAISAGTELQLKVD